MRPVALFPFPRRAAQELLAIAAGSLKDRHAKQDQR